MDEINNRPSPGEMTYAQAWEEYQDNGEAWRNEHDEALQQVRLEMPEAGSGALVEAGLIMAARPIGQRQEALSRWHEFFESDKKANKLSGYPSGHPNSEA
jgi:hypothetical protein